MSDDAGSLHIPGSAEIPIIEPTPLMEAKPTIALSDHRLARAGVFAWSTIGLFILLLGVLRVMAELLPGVTPTLAQTIFYLALFLTLMVRPQGFFGGRLAQRF